jgi:hypothetical protein
MGTTRKRRAVGVKRVDIVAQIVDACEGIDDTEAAALALIAAIFGELEIRWNDKIITIKDAKICAIGHLTKSR